MSDKIGLAIVTYKRQDYFERTLASLPKTSLDNIVVINDGPAYPVEAYQGVNVIQHEVNQGVAAAKNNGIKYLLDNGCDHIFTLEDDMNILDSTCFQQYVAASKKTGIQHFNYGPGSPFNRKQTMQNFDLQNRQKLNQDSEPNPKLVIDYGDDIKIALYEHTVAMFSYFTKQVIDKVGLIDTQFVNAWEHVDHTYQIIKAGFHPPFWWFADLANSDELMKPQDGAIDNSSIADKGNKWIENVQKGAELYRVKNGHVPVHSPKSSEAQVIEILKQIKRK